MATERRRLTVTAWAHEIGISKQAGYKAVQRCGIPLEDGLVDAEVATMLYKRRTRPHLRMSKYRTAQVAAAAPAAAPVADVPRTQDELLELAQGIADILADAADLAAEAEGLRHLLGVVARLDDATLARLRLSAATWDALVGEPSKP